MPAPIPYGELPLRPPPGLTPSERRRWLVVACELDRVRLQLAARQPPLGRIALSILRNVAPLAPLLPGRIGRWSRGIMQGTNLFRGVYDSMLN